MTDFFSRKFNNSKILILGFGREGRSTFRLFRKVFPSKHLTIADASAGIADDEILKKSENVSLITGKNYLNALNDHDIIVKSPGISLKDIKVDHSGITSQTDLFLQLYGEKVVGVTGTKGKSTTSTLIHHILTYSEKENVLLGNMGRPAFDHEDEINPETTVVYEMSSHQLEYLSASPHIAILLNFYQEHLDAYRSYLDYRMAKWNICRFQYENDIFIINEDDELITELLVKIPPPGKVYGFSMHREISAGCFISDDKIIFREEGKDQVVFDLSKKRKLQGEHNIRNIMAAIIATIKLGIDPVIIAEAVAGFRGLEHRLEDCGLYNGRRFFNDSIATIPEACIAAIKAIGEVDTLILGGFDRGIDYSGLASFLSGSGIPHLVFTGEAGKRIAEQVNKAEGQQIFILEKFDQFIDVVKKVTPPGKVCLLSPAAASYDEFPNFEIRGRRFKELISSNW